MDLVCDASSIITLSTNCLLWILKPLKKYMEGNFYIPLSVQKELINIPLKSNKYRFEALRVVNAIENENILVFNDEKHIDNITKDADRIQSWANSIFITKKKKNITLFHIGEAQAIALTKHLNTNALLIDEKTTRLLIEAPDMLKNIIQKRSKTKITVNEHALEQFTQYIENMSIIRSSELAMVAYEKGVFNNFLQSHVFNRRFDEELINGVLFAIKNSGCAITKKEIEEYIEIEVGGK